MADDPDLEPDVHVTQLTGLTTGPPDLVRLVGFLGTEVCTGYLRLYTDASLRSWIDLPKADIVRRERIGPAEGTTNPRSAVYVKGSAMRKPVRRKPHGDVEAEFLEASPDIEQLLPEVNLYDIALDATFIREFSWLCRTFRTCRP